MLGMMYHRFYQHADSNTFLQMYISLVRPHLEYGSPVWSPYKAGDIKLFEGVQKFALRMCTNIIGMNHSEGIVDSSIYQCGYAKQFKIKPGQNNNDIEVSFRHYSTTAVCILQQWILFQQPTNALSIIKSDSLCQ